MIPKEVLSEISLIVGERHLIFDKDGLTSYSSDATKLEYMPDAVVFPADAGEISRILMLATKMEFPVIPRGAGSGMSGGALPVRGGLIMGMDRLNRIISIDQDNLIAKVEPGVITSHLHDAVEKLGLFYPPDPASQDISTIGGNIAECAGGLRAVKYGVTRDYVLGLKIVLPSGEILKTGVQTMKGVAGYDLTRLLIGSEGTLAVVTEVTLRLIPKPAAQKTMLAFFPDVSAAAKTVAEIIRNKIIPSILEFMDKLCLDCVRKELQISFPSKAGAMLLMELDGDEFLIEREAQTLREVCRRGGALEFEAASDPAEAERLWEARRNVSPSLYKLRPNKISEDVVVPRSSLADLVDFLEELGNRYGLPVPSFGHAGDGNIHVNVMLDKNSDREMENARSLIKELFQEVIQMGGTITGEHGIGITKAQYLDMEIPKAGLELMNRIKKSFDPKGILNPGKIFLF